MAVKLSQGFLWALLIVWSDGAPGWGGLEMDTLNARWIPALSCHCFHLPMRTLTEVTHLPGSHKSESRPPLGFRPGSLQSRVS